MNYALVITAADGSVSVVGPFRSEEKAKSVSEKLELDKPGLMADVYEMEHL
jgi:hypothetical protein